ncbi:hypothetical protein EYF80_062150 [Liparis tanakae]|uniref:Uncharacterized protein n=1 Tax=Liparis tanakae TaxID=230148 RepID=A0A4Z2EGV5_9TELE|nr:hypothetical protein EYF80_062150 [Liparis tanakae]
MTAKANGDSSKAMGSAAGGGRAIHSMSSLAVDESGGTPWSVASIWRVTAALGPSASSSRATILHTSCRPARRRRSGSLMWKSLSVNLGWLSLASRTRITTVAVERRDGEPLSETITWGRRTKIHYVYTRRKLDIYIYIYTVLFTFFMSDMFVFVLC